MVSFLVRGFLRFWLPVLAWMIFIFIGSTDLMSAEHTSRFIGPFLRWFSPDISDAAVSSMQLVVRKMAHLAEYAVLAALLQRALRQNVERWFVAGLVAFGVCAPAAALDEYHQSFVASRTASPWDVFIDCIGALVGLLIYWRVTLRRKRSAERRPTP